MSLTLTDINIGSAPNDGTGDPARTAFGHINANNALIEAAIDGGFIVPDGGTSNDSWALFNACRTAAAGAVIALKPGVIYTSYSQTVMVADTTLDGNGATIKRGNQISTTLTSGVSVTAGSTATSVIPVASASGFSLGMQVGLEDRTGDPNRRFSTVSGTITNIAGLDITVAWGGQIATWTSAISAPSMTAGTFSGVSMTITTGAYVQTSLTTYTFPAGTYLATSCVMLLDAARCNVKNIVFDGNSANQVYALRWENNSAFKQSGTGSAVDNIYFKDSPSDAFSPVGSDTRISNIRVVNTGGNGIHPGASAPTTGTQRSIWSNILIDTVGLSNNGYIGHWGNNSYEAGIAYAGICFSDNIDHLVISNLIILNQQATTSKMCQGIGQIDETSNKYIQINDFIIKDQTHGGFHIYAGSSAPNDIEFNNGWIISCHSTAPDSIDNESYWTKVGMYYGTPPLALNVRLNNVQFIDSPFTINSVGTVRLSDVHCRATSASTFSPLILINSQNSTSMQVFLNDVSVTRPEGALSSSQARDNSSITDNGDGTYTVLTPGSKYGVGQPVTIGGSAPHNGAKTVTVGSDRQTGSWKFAMAAGAGTIGAGSTSTANLQQQFLANVYSGTYNVFRIIANGFAIIGGDRGWRCQGAPRVEITGLQCFNNYNYGVSVLETSVVQLVNPKIRVYSGFTASSSYMGLDMAGSGYTVPNSTIVNPDIDIYATSGGQTGIRLSKQATTLQGTHVQGGRIVVNGSVSGSSFLDTAPADRNEIHATLVYPAWTPLGTPVNTSVTLTKV